MCNFMFLKLVIITQHFCSFFCLLTVHPPPPSLSPYHSTPGWGYACSPGVGVYILTVHPPQSVSISQYALIGLRLFPGGWGCTPRDEGGGGWCIILTVHPPTVRLHITICPDGVTLVPGGGGGYNTYGPPPQSVSISQYAWMGLRLFPRGWGVYTYGPSPAVRLHITVRLDGVTLVPPGVGCIYLRSIPRSPSPYHSML